MRFFQVFRLVRTALYEWFGCSVSVKCLVVDQFPVKDMQRHSKTVMFDFIKHFYLPITSLFTSYLFQLPVVVIVFAYR